MTKGYPPFKMRGNPFKRNYGIGASPTKAEGVVDPDANVARATTQKTATGPMMKTGSPAKSEHVPGRSGKKPHDMGGGREAAYHPDKGSTIKGAGITKTGSPAKDMKYAFDQEGKASRHNRKHIDTKDDNNNTEHPWGHHETVQVKHLEKHAVKKTGSPANKITLISKEKRDRLKRGVKRSFADVKDLIGGGKRGRRRKSNARKIKSRIRH